jgi:uncharacterized membrane protein YqgA involved in biofilm formation
MHQVSRAAAAAAAVLQVGIPVDHHLLHMVELGGLIVAAVGSVVATLGGIPAVLLIPALLLLLPRCRLASQLTTTCCTW